MITLRLYKILKQIIYKINILNKNKIEIVKLWENASPTSDFAAQTIPLDLSEYQLGFFISRMYKDTTAETSEYSSVALLYKDKLGEIKCIAGNSNSFSGYVTMTGRQLKMTNAGIEVSQSYSASVSAQWSAQGGKYCIPIAFYGIKGVL